MNHMKLNRLYLIIPAMALMAVGCVPSRQYQDAVTARDNYKSEVELLNASLTQKDKQISMLEDQLEETSDSLRRAVRDFNDLQGAYDRLERANQELREIESLLNSRIKEILAISTTENQELNEKLNAREQEVVQKELALKEKESALEKQRADINALLASIADKEKRIAELESAIKNLNDKLTEVRTSLENALSGFSSSDLSIEQREGRIYINISEKLLFASGSTTVDPKGKEALKQVASALKTQDKVSIMVEGHTDNVPLKSANFPKDNWDLSVLRATTIVKLLTADYGLDPVMVEAAGRGEFSPKASNSDAAGRALNRRTEIIIIPDIQEINDILNQLSGE
ncbi:MAG TPA: hypothetical protein DCG24_04970 [Bacteroidetes bacterium]|nr:hypothetical protein [Bacteroidota bacterium]